MDTTNVVDHPLLTIITPVALDHQAFLGNSLEEIAREKAGILKRGVPCVVGRQADEAGDVIEACAERLGVPLLMQGQHWHCWEEHDRLVFQDDTGLLDLPLPVLRGAHQIDNAGIAIAALRLLGHGEAAWEAAVTDAVWPARMQRLTSGRLKAALPGGELWLDGGHNAHAAAAIAATLDTLPKHPTHLIFALLANRNPTDFLAPLARHADGLVAVPIPNEDAAADPETLAEASRDLGIETKTASGVKEALKIIAAQTPNARILICGSLYQAGVALRENA